MLVGVNFSKIDPHVKKSDADDYQQKELLECDHGIQNDSYRTWQFLLFKIKRNNGNALNKIDRQQHQQPVDTD